MLRAACAFTVHWSVIEVNLTLMLLQVLGGGIYLASLPSILPVTQYDCTLTTSAIAKCRLLAVASTWPACPPGSQRSAQHIKY